MENFKMLEENFVWYLYWMKERMNIFWSKVDGQRRPWTDDTILKHNKFTNVYRALDRVSQYLIREITNKSEGFSKKDMIWRVLLFKVFNKISTWELIEKRFGEVRFDNFPFEKVMDYLSEVIESKVVIFAHCYMLASNRSVYPEHSHKHKKFLSLYREYLYEKDYITKLVEAKSMEEHFTLLKELPLHGEFLSYQFSIDLNYTNLFQFDENSFVKVGPGAINGINKTFEVKDKNYEDIICHVANNIDKYRRELGEKYSMDLTFRPIPGREMTLIDYQNCFCETDKYIRTLKPDEVLKRIKQRYTAPKPSFDYEFPAHWSVKSIPAKEIPIGIF